MTWREVTFGSVCNLVNGRAYSERDWATSGTPIIRIQNLNDARSTFNYWPGSLDKQVRVRNGDVLLAWSGTPGTSFGAHVWNGAEGVLNQHIFRVDLDEKHVTKAWAVRAVNYRLYRLIAGAHGGVGLKHVTRPTVQSLSIPLPPLPEQMRIAAILDAAEALRDKQRQANALSEDLRRSMFAEMFGVNDEVFRRWPTAALGSLLSFLTSGSRGWARHYSDSGDVFLRIENVGRDRLLLDSTVYVQPPDTAEARRTRVRPDDVLLTITADLGRTAVIPKGVGTAYINQHLAILRTEAIDPRFLSAFIASAAGQKQVLGKNRQAVKAGLNFDDIRSLIIPVPPPDLQQHYRRFANALDRQSIINAAAMAKAKHLTQSLQLRAFRGEL